ncbi:unnamed protein product [Caenorhabditis bovis]|uniref:LIN-14 protein n=1 Tax=Caenorhabditis bovis TaxID=2654633 RepID=A0A8S1EMC5_9PELO|nr:unnamed protein product [Caenorhabditis bovis]
MDIPGPSNITTGSSNVVRPISVYYAPTTPPPIQQLPQPALQPAQLAALNPAFAATFLPFQFYQNSLNLLQMPKTQYLARSEISAFKEVNDLRTAVNMILPMLPIYQQLPNSLNAAATAALVSQQPQLSSVLTQNLLRKRSAAVGPQPNSASIPECPVSMRNVLSASQLQNALFLNQFMMPPVPSVSPTLPTGQLPIPTQDRPIITSEEQGVKWSSPSSVDSNGQKTDSSTASASDSHNIDIVGDGSESSTSSASAQDQIAQSIYNAVQNAAAQQKAQAELASVLKGDASMFFPNAAQPVAAATQAPASSAAKLSTAGPERKPRKPVNDDIVKIVRQQDLRPEAIATIEIPVPKAVESDPGFRPVSEQQIIQQIIQGKKYEEMEVGECMIQLCKKLAEKRVFGPRLMSQTTVAGLNHSNYSNLPIKGICYIQHVCWKVLRNRFGHDEEFWDKFREAMRKLAARCRRVRHAKKTKHNREESLAQQELLAKRFGEDGVLNVPSSLSHTIQSLGLGNLRPKTEANLESLLPNNDASNITIGQLGHLELQNIADTKSFKNLGEQETNVVQSLLRMANNDFGVKSEPLSPA